MCDLGCVDRDGYTSNAEIGVGVEEEKWSEEGEGI